MKHRTKSALVTNAKIKQKKSANSDKQKTKSAIETRLTIKNKTKSALVTNETITQNKERAGH